MLLALKRLLDTCVKVYRSIDVVYGAWMYVTLISLLILLARGITFGDMFFICIINVFRNTKSPCLAYARI